MSIKDDYIEAARKSKRREEAIEKYLLLAFKSNCTRLVEMLGLQERVSENLDSPSEDEKGVEKSASASASASASISISISALVSLPCLTLSSRKRNINKNVTINFVRDHATSLESSFTLAPEPLQLLLPASNKSLLLEPSSLESIEVLSRKVVSVEEVPRNAQEPLLLMLPPANKPLSSVSSSELIEVLSSPSPVLKRLSSAFTPLSVVPLTSSPASPGMKPSLLLVSLELASTSTPLPLLSTDPSLPDSELLSPRTSLLSESIDVLSRKVVSIAPEPLQLLLPQPNKSFDRNKENSSTTNFDQPSAESTLADFLLLAFKSNYTRPVEMPGLQERASEDSDSSSKDEEEVEESKTETSNEEPQLDSRTLLSRKTVSIDPSSPDSELISLTSTSTLTPHLLSFSPTNDSLSSNKNISSLLVPSSSNNWNRPEHMPPNLRETIMVSEEDIGKEEDVSLLPSSSSSNGRKEEGQDT